jgi:hypothetical protein
VVDAIGRRDRKVGAQRSWLNAVEEPAQLRKIEFVAGH